MRQITSALCVCSFVAVIMLVSIGWSSANKSGVVTVECTFAYRDTTVGDDEKGHELKVEQISVEIEVNADGGIEIDRIGEPKTKDLGDFRATVLAQSNSLTVRIHDKKENRLITSTLYQIDSELRNQFLGDHGFSGLNYVYHPTNASELQFFCVKKGFAEKK